MDRSRKAILVILATVITLSVGYVVWRATFNYFGYCREQKRYLTNDERIRIAIQNELATYPPYIQHVEAVPGGGLALIQKPRPERPVPYADVEEFIRVNPGCCSVSDKALRDLEPPFSNRIWGSVAAFVHMNYRVRYLDQNGSVIDEPTQTYVAISNCGRPWSGF